MMQACTMTSIRCSWGRVGVSLRCRSSRRTCAHPAGTGVAVLEDVDDDTAVAGVTESEAPVAGGVGRRGQRRR
jgi:hypothetical protein